MTLPAVAGWLIDFRTARAVFSAASSEPCVAHCAQACMGGFMHICHCEKAEFASVPQLKSTFVDLATGAAILPDDDIMNRCIAISSVRPQGKKQIVGNQAGVFAVATAAARNFGVITDHASPLFATAYELCVHYRIPALRSHEYFSSI